MSVSRVSSTPAMPAPTTLLTSAATMASVSFACVNVYGNSTGIDANYNYTDGVCPMFNERFAGIGNTGNAGYYTASSFTGATYGVRSINGLILLFWSKHFSNFSEIRMGVKP